MLSLESSLYSLDISPLSDMWLANIFSQSVVCLFCLLKDPLDPNAFLLFFPRSVLCHLTSESDPL